MTRLAANPETLRSLHEALQRLKTGEPVVLELEGRPLAALIGMEDLKLLECPAEEEEKRLDIEAADKVMAEIEAGRATLVPLQEAERWLDSLKV